MSIKDIILYNYNNNSNNIDNYYNYFKKYNINILSLRTDCRSGIIKYKNKKIHFYILNNNIDIEEV